MHFAICTLIIVPVRVHTLLPGLAQREVILVLTVEIPLLVLVFSVGLARVPSHTVCGAWIGERVRVCILVKKLRGLNKIYRYHTCHRHTASPAWRVPVTVTVESITVRLVHPLRARARQGGRMIVVATVCGGGVAAMAIAVHCAPAPCFKVCMSGTSSSYTVVVYNCVVQQCRIQKRVLIDGVVVTVYGVGVEARFRDRHCRGVLLQCLADDRTRDETYPRYSH